MKIGSLFNVDVKISVTLVVFVALAVVLGKGAEIAIIFFVFMAHESAHVLVARALKMEVKEIELLPFGGAVRIEGVFELSPVNEICIALAGPAMNIFLLLGYSALCNLGLVSLENNDIFAKANLILAGFNLLPALPLDGGRALRAILSREIGFKKATKTVALGGVLLSLFLAMIGLYALSTGIFNPNFFFISGFLVYSAFKEMRTASYTFVRDISFKRGIIFKKGVLVSRDLVVLYDLPLKTVINKFVPHRYHFVKVIDHSLRVWGYLDETEIINGMVEYGVNAQIGRLLQQK